MDYNKLVQQEYRKAVAESKVASPELKASLRTSDRVPQFLSRMALELAKAEAVVFQRRGKPLKLETIKWGIRGMTEQFLANVEAQAQARMTSPLEASRLKAELDLKMEPEKYLREMGVQDAPQRPGEPDEEPIDPEQG